MTVADTAPSVTLLAKARGVLSRTITYVPLTILERGSAAPSVVKPSSERAFAIASDVPSFCMRVSSWKLPRATDQLGSLHQTSPIRAVVIGTPKAGPTLQ